MIIKKIKKHEKTNITYTGEIDNFNNILIKK